jgi:hypothetical protein
MFSFFSIDTSLHRENVKNNIDSWARFSKIYFHITIDGFNSKFSTHDPTDYPNLLYVFDDKATYVALSTNESLNAKFNAIKCLKLSFNDEIKDLQYPSELIVLIFGDIFDKPICYLDSKKEILYTTAQGKKSIEEEYNNSTTCERLISGTTFDDIKFMVCINDYHNYISTHLSNRGSESDEDSDPGIAYYNFKDGDYIYDIDDAVIIKNLDSYTNITEADQKQKIEEYLNKKLESFKYKSVFPKSLNKLKYLCFGESFNQPLGKLITNNQDANVDVEFMVQTYLPSNIEVLHLGKLFNHPIGHYRGNSIRNNVKIVSLLPPNLKVLYIEGKIPMNNTNIFKGMIQLYSANSVRKKELFKQKFFADFKYLVYQNINIEEIGHEYLQFDDPILNISNADNNMVISNNRDKLLQIIEDRRQLHINSAINPPQQPLTFRTLPRVGDPAAQQTDVSALPPPPPLTLAR